jgi:DNA-binding transcriptional LysR family regulator
MTIDLRQLRYAVLTADRQSFASAARSLNVKQSTLSRCIAALEDRLGLQLFERNSRGAVPTRIGRNFLNLARRIITDVDNLQTTARAVSYGIEGRFTLGFCSSLMVGNLKMTIADFMERHPDMQFDAVEAGHKRLRAGLDTYTVDAAITPMRVGSADLQSRHLWSERLFIAMADDHRLAEQHEIFWTDLRHEVFVAPGEGVGLDAARVLTNKLAGNGYRAQIIRQSTSLEAVLSTVSLGRYLAITTEASLGVTWPGLQFRQIMDQGAPARIDYSLYWREDNENPALRHFFKLINERHPA